IWLFNPELRYTTSVNTICPTRAVKILHHELPPAELQRLIKPPASVPSLISVEEVALPLSIYHDLMSTLLDTQKMLPVSARKASLGGPTKGQEWNVALLKSG
ncbi:hypothetical protein KEM56_001479, partial [Ascosphaera pollenicola]